MAPKVSFGIFRWVQVFQHSLTFLKDRGQGGNFKLPWQCNYLHLQWYDVFCGTLHSPRVVWLDHNTREARVRLDRWVLCHTFGYIISKSGVHVLYRFTTLVSPTIWINKQYLQWDKVVSVCHPKYYAIFGFLAFWLAKHLSILCTTPLFYSTGGFAFFVWFLFWTNIETIQLTYWLW